MKIFAILILLFATVLPAQTLGDYDAAYPGLDFALHSTFIRCYVHHWKGSQTVNLVESGDKIKMTCTGFWNKFVSAYKNPSDADSMPSPFELLSPGNPPDQIPFSIWNGYLSATLAISDSNPLRKSE